MARCWKRIQVPKGFTIWMWIALALLSVVGLIYPPVLLPETIRKANILLFGVMLLLLILGLLSIFTLIVWIIFTLKKIYAPIGSTADYGQRQPLNNKYKTYTYSTWLYVSGMVIYGIASIMVTILGVFMLYSLTHFDPWELTIGLIVFVLGGVSTGLWIWFIIYQTKPLYKNK